jgi:hypothetical protein
MDNGTDWCYCAGGWFADRIGFRDSLFLPEVSFRIIFHHLGRTVGLFSSDLESKTRV